MLKSKKTLKDKVINFRGSFLESFSGLESVMDLYIANHFSDDVNIRADLLSLILKTHRITVESKRQVFDHISKTKFPTRYKKFPRTHKDIIALIETRNIIAHYQVDYSDEAIETQDKQITFLKYKNIESKVYFTNNDQKILLLKIDACTEILEGFIYFQSI